MSTSASFSSVSLDEIEDNLDQLSFYEVVRALQSGFNDARIGTDALPSRERLKIQSSQQLAMATQSVDKLTRASDGSNTVRTTLPSLTGPNGVLPKHYSELVLQRIRHKDHAMAAFYDLFNHRVHSLSYRAWEKYQMPMLFENELNKRGEQASELVSAVSAASLGIERYYAGHFTKQTRSAKRLQHMLESYTRCDVSIRQNIGCWKPIAEQDRSRLGGLQNREGQHSRLGMSVMLGKKCWDIQSKVEICIEAADEKRARHFMPGAESSNALIALTRRYLPPSIHANCYVKTKFKFLQRLSLGKAAFGLGNGARLSAQSNKLEQWTKVKLG